MSSYIDHKDYVVGHKGPVVTHSWADFTSRRLAWLYGEERASLIRAGRDPATLTDVARWNALGGRRAA